MSKIINNKLFSLLLLLTFQFLGCRVGNTNSTKNLIHDQFNEKRKNMIEFQIIRRGIKGEKLLKALENVPREKFVPNNLKSMAYEDGPLPIGLGQTISQPYIVANMTEQLDIKEDDRILEIGTGSGYQAAILGELAKEVYTIEIVTELCTKSKTLLKELDYNNISVKCGDGYQGWPEHAPFNKIILTAAPPKIPAPLIEQLGPNGVLIAPVGEHYQSLILMKKSTTGKLIKKELIPVRFVPMTGEAQK